MEQRAREAEEEYMGHKSMCTYVTYVLIVCGHTQFSINSTYSKLLKVTCISMYSKKNYTYYNK